MSDEEKLDKIRDLLDTEKWDWDLCAKISDVLAALTNKETT